jgi:membrane-associated phospholipid phosphatase
MTKILRKAVAVLALFTLELVLILGIILTCVVVFLWLGREILQGQEIDFDLKAFAWADSFSSELFTQVMIFITFFASRNFITFASLALIFYFLFVRKHKWHSLRVPVIAIGSISLNLILKYFFDRPRPLVPHLVESSGLSFPSGHAMISASFYGLLIYLVWYYVAQPSRRWILIILLVCWILLIGFSRVYLHVHYATDVIAGYAVGLLWVIVASYSLKKIERYTGKKMKPVLTEE